MESSTRLVSLMTTPNRLWLAASRAGYVLWRNNVGKGWWGRGEKQPDGAIVIRHPRRLHAGLCVGSADYVGYRSMTITPEMVGQKVAVFAGVEAKRGSRRLSEEQKVWRELIQRAGGIFIEARRVEDFL